jgi:hypothetical protein
MSILLEAGEGRTLKVNAWNWGVLHFVVQEARLFPDSLWEPLRHNSGSELDPDQVATLAGFLERSLLPRLKEGERMFFDGTVTNVPDDGTFYREEKEMWKNYSLHRSVLVSIIGLIKAAGSPVRVS